MTLCTIAGTGTSGYNDINIRATETQLRDPTALVEDADGRLLVSDAGNHQVRRFEDDMLMTVIGRNKNSEAVSGLASQTPLNYVVDMDFDGDGELLLLEGGLQLSWVDLSADAIEVFASSVGTPDWNSAAETPVDEMGLIKPTSTAIDDDGNIYISESGDGFNMILKVSVDGVVTRSLASMRMDFRSHRPPAIRTMPRTTCSTRRASCGTRARSISRTLAGIASSASMSRRVRWSTSRA